MEAPKTPPRASTAKAGGNELTPEQVKRMEVNRMKAKARLEERKGKVEVVESGGDGKKRSIDRVEPARKMAKYIDYDFSKMTDSKGGFLHEDNVGQDGAPKKVYEPKRILEPPISLDPAANPTCYDCGTIEIDYDFFKTFACRVCRTCRDKFPDKYSLLTKTECRSDYLLTDPELRDTDLLRHMERPNPHKNTWNNMMLYLRYQVEEVATKKWGTLDTLDKEFERRAKEKKEQKDKKFTQKLAELKRKTRVATWKRTSNQRHEHVWSEPLDAQAGTSVRICQDCGMETEEIVF